ncbi:MAG: hypothetical protein KIT58_01595 [Planctomycetota bacterium]|nr:hypothetical protein [Planctomycetota bacterium]
MVRRFEWVGTVRKARAGSGHVVGEVPGKVALVIADVHAGECLGYFPRERRPRIGARIGARGAFVVMDVPPEQVAPEDRDWALLPGCQPVQHQLDVEDWTEVGEDYDWLFD